jgi:peptidoglycan/LPS O-acetylase OafA/YrhL
MTQPTGAEYRTTRDTERSARTQPQRLAAALLLAGVLLVVVAILAFWVIFPAAGAALTLAIGAGLVVVGLQAIPGRNGR